MFFEEGSVARRYAEILCTFYAHESARSLGHLLFTEGGLEMRREWLAEARAAFAQEHRELSELEEAQLAFAYIPHYIASQMQPFARYACETCYYDQRVQEDPGFYGRGALRRLAEEHAEEILNAGEDELDDIVPELLSRAALSQEAKDAVKRNCPNPKAFRKPESYRCIEYRFEEGMARRDEALLAAETLLLHRYRSVLAKRIVELGGSIPDSGLPAFGFDI